MPKLIDFSEAMIKKTTYEKDALRAVVGISGGLDSAVASYLTATALDESRKTNRSSAQSLVLLGFTDVNSTDTPYMGSC